MMGFFIALISGALMSGGQQYGLWESNSSAWPLTMLMVRGQHPVVVHQ